MEIIRNSINVILTIFVFTFLSSLAIWFLQNKKNNFINVELNNRKCCIISKTELPISSLDVSVNCIYQTSCGIKFTAKKSRYSVGDSLNIEINLVD